MLFTLAEQKKALFARLSESKLHTPFMYQQWLEMQRKVEGQQRSMLKKNNITLEEDKEEQSSNSSRA